MNQQAEVKDTVCVHSFSCLSLIQQTENLTGLGEIVKKTKQKKQNKKPPNQKSKQTTKKPTNQTTKTPQNSPLNY